MASRSSLSALDFISSSPATIYNNANLGTGIIRCLPPSTASPSGVRLLQITNKHATNYVSCLATDAASPSFAASAAGAIASNEGINVAPGTSYFLNAGFALSLWLVASAASTPVQVVSYEKAVR